MIDEKQLIEEIRELKRYYGDAYYKEGRSETDDAIKHISNMIFNDIIEMAYNQPKVGEKKAKKNTERPDANSLTDAYRRLELMAINLTGEAAKGNNGALKDCKAINVAQWAVKEYLREKGENTWI
ncbi:hypothetical protein LI177_02840 [bacterium 210820-DFI.6.37]|nr:hypothetical protein [bacterium 210820-DFI.6.37]